MNDARRATLDFETIVNAFDVMGRYLRDECSVVGEISFFPGETLRSRAAARLPELAEKIRLRRTG
jgi:hypothetical protein